MNSAAALVMALSIAVLPLPADARPTGPGGALAAGGPTALPPAAREADIEERLGQMVRKDLAFTDMEGRRTRLADHLEGDKPLVLVLAYYRCPTLCDAVLRGVVDALGELSLRPGEDYRALTVSFDPRDRPEAAKAKRERALSALGRARGAAPPQSFFPFLVGEEPEIRALADDLGFRYGYDRATDQYAHPAAIFVLTPEGRISRYLYGVEYPALDLRLSLLQASEGRVGGIADRILMTCYRYDPALRRYGPTIAGFFRLGGVAILVSVTGLLAAIWRRDRKLREGSGGGGR